MSADISKNYSPQTDLLHERVILVTGAGDGIGRAVSSACARHGAMVILLSRTSAKLESLYDELLAAGCPEPAIAVMDLAKAQGPDYYDLAQRIESEYGRLDGLLHNAAVLGERTPLEQYGIGTWHEVMHLNLTVPFVMTQTLLPLLKRSADASVLFTTSGVGRQGRAYWGAYAVSKFGIEGLSQVLADETSSAGIIRVNCINPGAARTHMRRQAYPAEDPKRLPQPEDLMGPYLYLLGPDSRGVTGQSINCQ